MSPLSSPTLLCALLLMGSASADDRIRAEAWRHVRIYDMEALQKVEPLPLGQVVGVRFNYRAKPIRHLKPNWPYGSIWSRPRDAGQERADHIPIMVARAALRLSKQFRPSRDRPAPISFTARC